MSFIHLLVCYKSLFASGQLSFHVAGVMVVDSTLLDNVTGAIHLAFRVTVVDTDQQSLLTIHTLLRSMPRSEKRKGSQGTLRSVCPTRCCGSFEENSAQRRFAA